MNSLVCPCLACFWYMPHICLAMAIAHRPPSRAWVCHVGTLRSPPFVHAKYAAIEDVRPPQLLLELARAVYKERVVETNTGTISNLTKAQVAFIWAVVRSCTPAHNVHAAARCSSFAWLERQRSWCWLRHMQWGCGHKRLGTHGCPACKRGSSELAPLVGRGLTHSAVWAPDHVAVCVAGAVHTAQDWAAFLQRPLVQSCT